MGTIEIIEPGFLFVYLSYENESDNWVYFDDLKVAHTKNNVVQYNDYYPYGLKANASWTREDSGNNRLYNQGNELSPSTGWYETFFRDYDPALGRFTAIDPLASKFASLSGYHYAYNNPVMFNDPLGAQGEPGNPWFGGGYRWMENMGPPPAAYNSMGASTFGSTMDNYWYQAMSGSNWGEQMMHQYQLASQARGGDMGAVREYAARYGGGLTTMEVWHSTAQAGGETYYHYEIVANGVNAQNGGTDWLQVAKDVSLYGGIQTGFIVDQSVDIALREGRGRYDGPNEFLRKQANLKSISKITKGVSLGFTALSVGVSFAEFSASDQSGADYARLIGAGVIIGTNFIPYAGPLISTSLAIGDATGQFDSFYNGFDNAYYRSAFFNSLISGGRTIVGPFKP